MMDDLGMAAALMVGQAGGLVATQVARRVDSSLHLKAVLAEQRIVTLYEAAGALAAVGSLITFVMAFWVFAWWIPLALLASSVVVSAVVAPLVIIATRQQPERLIPSFFAFATTGVVAALSFAGLAFFR